MKAFVTNFVVTLLFAFSGALYACQLLPGESVPVVQFPHKFKENLGERGYVYQLLKLAIAQSVDKFGPCEARLVMNKLPVKRMEMYLEQGDLLQVVDLSVSDERDTRFSAVTVPVHKGLVGNRVFFVRKGEGARFSEVKTLFDLGEFVAGQGEHWSDTKIMRANGLRVNTTKNIVSLIDMLEYKRFDYFPRGANEILIEMNIYADRNIEVEQSLVLSYPYMSALYVNKTQTQLQQRLTYGLEKAISDGSFDQLFYYHPTNVKVIEGLKLLERHFIQVCNPVLPAWVPIENAKYWLRPWPDTMRRGTACLGGGA